MLNKDFLLLVILIIYLQFTTWFDYGNYLIIFFVRVHQVVCYMGRAIVYRRSKQHETSINGISNKLIPLAVKMYCCQLVAITIIIFKVVKYRDCLISSDQTKKIFFLKFIISLQYSSLKR